MKKIQKEVKSKGEVVDTVEVLVYESIPEALKAKTEAFCLAAINKAVEAGIVNPARTAKVRPTTASAQLTRLAKDNPKVKARIDAILAEFSKK